MHPLLSELVSRRRQMVWCTADGDYHSEPQPPPAGILSGSFNPLHAGHCELRQVAERILGGPVHFELPIVNADKPPLDPAELQRRVEQFTETGILLTVADTFVKKAQLLSGTTFVVGYDTAERILQPRFYGHSTENMKTALEGIRDAGCSFLVAGRLINESFHTVNNLNIPVDFNSMFTRISQNIYRSDVSSTDIRDNDLQSDG